VLVFQRRTDGAVPETSHEFSESTLCEQHHFGVRFERALISAAPPRITLMSRLIVVLLGHGLSSLGAKRKMSEKSTPLSVRHTTAPVIPRRQ
jgi:hypothetical protein